MYKDHLTMDSAADDPGLEKKVENAFARAKTTKAECLIIKAFANASKDNEAKCKSYHKHREELEMVAKVDANDWLHPTLIEESAIFEPKKGDDKDKAKKLKKDGKKKTT